MRGCMSVFLGGCGDGSSSRAAAALMVREEGAATRRDGAVGIGGAEIAEHVGDRHPREFIAIGAFGAQHGGIDAARPGWLAGKRVGTALANFGAAKGRGGAL